MLLAESRSFKSELLFLSETGLLNDSLCYVTRVGCATTNCVTIVGLRAEPDESGKNEFERIYIYINLRPKSVGLCFVCEQRKTGLLCYLPCCLSKARVSASFVPPEG